jgi:hypothetical protein
MATAGVHLMELGYPGRDDASLPSSQSQFSAGGDYGIEVASVNNQKILEEVLRLADHFDLRIDRVDECRGIFRLPDDEIRSMVATCRERQVGLVMSVGPRAVYDTGGFSRSPNGVRIGYRLRGMSNLAYAVEDVLRAAEMGVRGFLVYDEGLLDVLGQMRASGALPAESMLKLSVHAGCSNPASARLFSRIGADTINLVPDLELPMLSAIRQATPCPLDLFSDTAGAAGGMIRTYDIPEFIRVAAPVYIKGGAVSQPYQNHLPSTTEREERMKQVRCVVEMIQRAAPHARPVNRGERTLAIPAGPAEAKPVAYPLDGLQQRQASARPVVELGA